MLTPIDLTGQRFGQWLVLERAIGGRGRGLQWICRCDCGAEAIVFSNNLRTGKSHRCKTCASRSARLKDPQNTNRMVVGGVINRLPKLSDAELEQLRSAVVAEIDARIW